ncbi:MAG: thioesterase family protein [Propionicimonas sp.]
MTFLVRVPLRWVDLDTQGHVNNAVLTDYLQEARVAFLLSGENAHMLGTSSIVVNHQVEFLRPVVYAVEPVEVELSVGKVGGATVAIGYTVRQQGAEVARARTQLAKARGGHAERMTPAERAWFTGHQTALAPLRELGRWQVGQQACSFEFTVRWSDIDQYGHVNNVRVFDYVAEARNHLNPDGAELTRMQLASASGTTWLVARQDVDYLAEIKHRAEPYRVRTGYAAVGRTSMTLVAQVEDPVTDRVHARTLTVLVHGDDQGRPIPVPEAAHRGLERWPAVAVKR